jgi:hypothetical protein
LVYGYIYFSQKKALYNLHIKAFPRGGTLELVTLTEKKHSRVYNFLEFDQAKQVIIHKQFEYRDGKILVRAKVRQV